MPPFTDVAAHDGLAFTMRRLAGSACAAQALARRAQEVLQAALDARGIARLIVAGGRTPAACFDALSTAPLDWSRVHVTLTDERWVDPDDDASNGRLVRRHLLRGAAAAAHFVPLKTDAATAWEALSERTAALAEWLAGADLAMLGMGDDGHFASLFPDAKGIGEALDVLTPPGLVAIDPPRAAHARLSLNMAAILKSEHIAILAQGAAKLEALQHAARAGDASPLAALLKQRHPGLEVFWSP